MCIDNKKMCCAPVANGERCTKQTVSTKVDHCSEHIEEAVYLYNLYKSICKIANSKNMDLIIKDPTKCLLHLQQCHSALVDSYEARLKHHLFAYVPQCSDKGHMDQLQIIKDKIEICRQKITTQLTLIKEKPHKKKGLPFQDNYFSSIQDQEEIIIEDNTLQCVVQNISKEVAVFKKKQSEDDLAFDKILKDNIRKNKKIAKERRKAAALCANLISNEIGFDVDNTFFNQIALINLIVETYNLGYYNEDYCPVKCICSAYEPFQTKNGCPCLLKKDRDAISYLYDCSITTPHLKLIYNIILGNLDKIRPMISEYMNCYKIHGIKLLNKIITFTWYDEKQRLILTVENGTFYRRKRNIRY